MVSPRKRFCLLLLIVSCLVSSLKKHHGHAYSLSIRDLDESVVVVVVVVVGNRVKARPH